jgi:hypothetical protein
MSDLDGLRDKYLSILMEEADKALSAEERKSSATIIRTKNDGTKEYKFPMPDEKHARLALSMINTSDLSQSEKEKVRSRAERMIEAADKGYHKMPDGKMMKDEDHRKMKEGGWDKPWTKEDESKMPADEKKMMMEAWSKMGDADKKKMMKEYGSYGAPMKKYMMEGYGMSKKMVEGHGKKKESMKEASGMVGTKASGNPPTDKKMAEMSDDGSDMDKTGDPKKKPVKTKGKSWLAKGDSEPSAS